MISKNKPNLFIVGAPKAGTTSVHYYLSQHPDVCMSSVKEPNHFSAAEIADLYYGTVPVADHAAYLQLFDRPAKVIGEASVSYLYYDGIAKKLHDYNPEAKILIILRNPIERAISHYLMDRRLGYCSIDLQTILDDPQRYPDFYQQFILLGDYSEQIQRYLSVFGADAVRIMNYEDLKAGATSFMMRVFEFLALAPISIDLKARNEKLAPRNRLISQLYQVTALRRGLKQVLPAPLSRAVSNRFLRGGKEESLSPGLRERLAEHYRKDLPRLSVLLGFDCDSWYGTIAQDRN